MAYAPDVYKALSGIFCVYKPPGKTIRHLLDGLKRKLSQDLNKMTVRPPRQMVQYEESADGSTLPVITTVPDLADHTLVVGPRYEPDDLSVSYCSTVKKHTSGVLVCGIGEGRRKLTPILKAQHMRVYQIKGELGRATDDFTVHGRTLSRATHYHVTRAKIDRIVAAMQAGHQKHMYEAAGVDPGSEEAYELAVKGLIRPMGLNTGAVIYNMKCLHYEPPHFTLEVHTINESCDYLMGLIHQLGIEMKTCACVAQLRRTRYGPFTVDHTLSEVSWNPLNIVNNIKLCREVLGEGKVRYKPLLQEAKPPKLLESQKLLHDPDW